VATGGRSISCSVSAAQPQVESTTDFSEIVINVISRILKVFIGCIVQKSNTSHVLLGAFDHFTVQRLEHRCGINGLVDCGSFAYIYEVHANTR
jgi:hypothetical protein